MCMKMRRIIGLWMMLCILLTAGCGHSKQAEGNPPLPVEEDAVEWEGSREEYSGAEAASESIALPGMDEMNFKANEKIQTVNLYNPAENSCYFKISILLEDGTVLYQSNLIAPGKGLYDIELQKALPEGTYENSVLKYECFDMDEDYTPLNGAELTLTILSIR